MSKDTVSDIMTPTKTTEFYYWLYENSSPKAANLWLEGKWDEFIQELSS